MRVAVGEVQLAFTRKHRDALNALIEEVTSAMDTATLIEKMNAAGVPCGPINNIAQAFDDPQVKHLSIAQTVQSAALGKISQPEDIARAVVWLLEPDAVITGQMLKVDAGFTLGRDRNQSR